MSPPRSRGATTQAFLRTVPSAPQRAGHRLRLHRPLVPRLHKEGSTVEHRRHGGAGPRLPGPHRIQDRLGDRRDEGWRSLCAVALFPMTLHVARREATRIQAHDVVVAALQAALALGHELLFPSEGEALMHRYGVTPEALSPLLAEAGSVFEHAAVAQLAARPA